MGGVYGTHRREQMHTTYWSQNVKEGDHLENTCMNSREISESMLMECSGGIRIGTGHGL